MCVLSYINTLVGTLNLNWYINAYKSKILVRNPNSYETGNSRNLGIQNFSSRISGIKETGNSEMTDFSSISKFQHLKIPDGHHFKIPTFENPRQPPDMNSRNSSKEMGPNLNVKKLWM